MFKLEQLTIDLVKALRPIVERIARSDRGLADQLRRSASSVALNVAESAYAKGANRKALLHVAAGSANESRAALKVAAAWGYVEDRDVMLAADRIDHVLAVLWKLTH